MKRMIPASDEDRKLPTNADLFARTSRATAETLNLALPVHVSTV
jgi:hypothetical protein